MFDLLPRAPHARLPLLVLLVHLGCAEGAPPPADLADADGDFVPDALEGADLDPPRDSDGDGLPDHLDLDSDQDGIGDALEGRMSPLEPVPFSSPPDSDADGLADLVDVDSDDNGLADWVEGTRDTMGFGDLDFRTLDDDRDGLLDRDEIALVVDPLMDSDGDGAWNFQDADSDGDGIHDGNERLSDADRDGLPNALDLDSDGDGLPDSAEAGDGDVWTPAVDTDGDSQPDFLDLDSDGDGLLDAREVALGTSPVDADTDGDGVDDLVEVVGCLDPDSGCLSFPVDPTRSPRTEGNFVFVVPFDGDPRPPRDTLRFRTDIRQADVYLMMDTTCSMGGAIRSLKENLTAEPGGLIARVRDTIPDAWYGVADFRDYPVSPYGARNVDYAYNHIQDMTADPAVAQRAVNTLETGSGADLPESHVAALFATATGQGLPGASWPDGSSLPARTGCPRGTFGYPCFRARAVPIAVLMSDVDWHNGPQGAHPYDNAAIGGPTPTWEQAVAAFVGRRMNFIGIAVNGDGALPHQEAFGAAVGSVDADDRPFVTEWLADTPISDAVVDQIELLASQSRFDVTIRYEDAEGDDVDTWAAFVQQVEAVPGGTLAECPFRVPVDTDADGLLDTFYNVGARSGVCFEVVVKRNATVPAQDEPQLFRATLRVLGDGVTELDVRDIFFLVPPHDRIGVPG